MAEKVGIVSLGCAKNRVDSEQALGLLKNWGYEITGDPQQADILIVNTCGFIEPAKQESIDSIFEMAQYKEEGNCKILIATGCLTQRYGQELLEEIPELDAVLGVGEYPRLKEILEDIGRGRRPMACNRSRDVFEGPRVLTTPQYSAYVRISDGCDNRCTYCAIPMIRGGYRSRPYENVMAETRKLVEEGTKEITFIAQDTTRFGDDLPGRPTLAKLVKDACRLDGVRWVRTLYCYPSRVDDELLDVLAQEEKACSYLDLPLQHIDEKMLKAMNRQGTPEEIRSLLRRARERELTLRTTLIVGFPGETEDQFRRLLDFVEETRFDRLGAFTYSPEEGTPGAEMPDQIPEEIQQERLDRLMKLQQKISLENSRKRIGTECEVLLERRTVKGWIGRSRLEAPEGDGEILLHARRVYQPGDFVRARMTDAQEYDLTGEII